ncbi:hypothetical protein D9619_013706 [Psilocybe cf. subviscida]|uniref:HAT C-terminal dimerisation domain-containing protein n=1 Tax=Psilocybe cf. subviscida TaxID=2480587 RepID=A0A8H5AZ69_9AGAR|nr:hypothetical protein D9619_013706 [Psilocybe cf. subviscida]
MLATVSAIANYFGKSNYGTHHLMQQRKLDGIKHGIKSHSETRFSSSYQQVLSVNACMPSIKKCVQAGSLKFDTAATKRLLPFITEGAAHYNFLIKMTGFTQLLSSGANGILTLEGQNTTCADVFYVWVCIAYQLEIVLTSSDAGVSQHQCEVVAIFNARFTQMMTESSHELFLVAYFLHPMYREHGGLQLSMPPLSDGRKLSPAQYPNLFRRILTCVLKMFREEQLRHQDSGAEVVKDLIDEFTRYAYNDRPFKSRPFLRGMKPLEWWEGLSNDSNASLLAKIAIKLFSISPSEICDERIASRLGWLNAARRSAITPEHLIDSAKLYDYYVNGLTEGNFEHTAHVHIPPTSKSGPSKQPDACSVPSASEPVNTSNLEPTDVDSSALEERLFCNPDPYDLAETDRVDAALQCNDLTVQSSVHFEIDNIIKLDEEKLVKLITGGSQCPIWLWQQCVTVT